MEDTNNIQNTAQVASLKPINTKPLMLRLQEMFKRYRESNTSMEQIPVKQEKQTPQSLKPAKKPYGPMTGKTGRGRAGYTIGIYLDTKPYPYNNGGIIKNSI